MFSKGISIYYLTINLFFHAAYSECPTRIPMPLSAYSAVPRSEMPSINQFFPYLSEQSNITSLASHNNLIKFITAKEINSEVAETETGQLTVTEVFDSNLSSVITNDGIEEEKLMVEKVLISNETLTKESENVKKIDVTPKVLSSHQIKKKMIPALKPKPKYIQHHNDNPTPQTPKMIPIFKPKENIRNINMHRALPAPVNNLNTNPKTLKSDLPYQNIPNDKSPNVQSQLNQMKFNANLNPVPKTSKFDLPCQRASDILNEPLNDILKGNPTCRLKDERKQFFNMHRALPTPVNNLNINPKIVKSDLPYQNIPNNKSPNVQPQLNHMKVYTNVNSVLKSTKFDLPRHRVSDNILNEPINDILKGNPTSRMKPVERKQFLNLKPTIKRPNRNLQCQRLPDINQRFQKTIHSKDTLVLMKPKTTTITKDCGNIVKKITTAVLLPSCIVNLTR